MSNNGPFISLVSFISVRTAVIVVLIFIDIVFCMCERPILPQITQIIADKPQNRKTALTSPICLSLRYNAALLHSSAGSAWSAREYTSKLTQSICTEETPMSPADFADLRRQTTITTKQPLPQTNCLSLRDNAACCIPLRYLRNLRENNTQEDSINPHKRNPSVSRRSRRFTQTNHKTTKQP